MELPWINTSDKLEIKDFSLKELIDDIKKAIVVWTYTAIVVSTLPSCGGDNNTSTVQVDKAPVATDFTVEVDGSPVKIDFSNHISDDKDPSEKLTISFETIPENWTFYKGWELVDWEIVGWTVLNVGDTFTINDIIYYDNGSNTTAVYNITDTNEATSKGTITIKEKDGWTDDWTDENQIPTATNFTVWCDFDGSEVFKISDYLNGTNWTVEIEELPKHWKLQYITNNNWQIWYMDINNPDDISFNLNDELRYVANTKTVNGIEYVEKPKDGFKYKINWSDNVATTTMNNIGIDLTTKDVDTWDKDQDKDQTFKTIELPNWDKNKKITIHQPYYEYNWATEVDTKEINVRVENWKIICEIKPNITCSYDEVNVKYSLDVAVEWKKWFNKKESTATFYNIDNYN